QRLVPLEEVIPNVEVHVRGTTDMDRKAGLAAGARPDVIGDIVHLELALRQARAGRAVVIDDVVAKVKSRIGRPIVVIAESWVAPVVVGPQVMVERHGTIGPGERSVAVWAFRMKAPVQG